MPGHGLIGGCELLVELDARAEELVSVESVFDLVIDGEGGEEEELEEEV